MKVFVANRGEIAARLARGLRSLGIASAGLHVPDDAMAPHRWLLGECPPAPSEGGYLDGTAMVALAQQLGCTAVHPGYGFLSQSPEFVELVQAAGLTFIGPSVAAMRQLGDKAAARLRARALGVPVCAGEENVLCLPHARRAAEHVGYPVVCKAPNAGGGRGLVRADDAQQLADAFARAQRVAGIGCGVVVERFLPRVRHVEVQVAASQGRAVALGTRDCSSQRRLQKVIEEAPASAVPAAIAQAMASAAERLFVDAQYVGVGTAEFLFDPAGGPAGEFYFLEVNPRLQVEHPVTEAVLGIDLVAAQLALARGEPVMPASPAVRGHAIEVRLNAEEPHNAFLPASGTVRMLSWPSGPGIRVDAGVAEGSTVGTQYDSLLAKIIAWAPTRSQARESLLQALEETVLLGVASNRDHLLALVGSERFAADDIHTRWLADVAFAPVAAPLPLEQFLQGKASAELPSLVRPRLGPVLPSAFARGDRFGRDGPP